MITKRTWIIGGLLSIALFILGFLSWEKIFIALLPEIDGEYTTSGIGSWINKYLLFGATLALIPITAVFIWKKGSVSTPASRTLSVALMLAGMVISVFIMRELLKFVAVPIDFNIQLNIPIDQIRFEFHAFVGLVLGSTIAWLLLRDK